MPGWMETGRRGRRFRCGPADTECGPEWSGGLAEGGTWEGRTQWEQGRSQVQSSPWAGEWWGEGSKSSGTQKPMKLRYKMQRPGGSPHLTWVWKEQVYRRKLVQQPTCFRGCDCKPNPIVWRQAVPRNKTASQETKKMLLVLL